MNKAYASANASKDAVTPAYPRSQRRTDEVPPPPPSSSRVGRLVALAPLLTTHRAGAAFPGAPRVPHFETPHLPDLAERTADARARRGGWADTWQRDTVPTRPEGLGIGPTEPSRLSKLEQTALLVTVVGASAFALGFGVASWWVRGKLFA